MMSKRGIVIVQPMVPNYRTDFFQRLASRIVPTDIFVFEKKEESIRQGFKINDNLKLNISYIANKNVHEVLAYNPLPLLSKRYDTLVLMLHFAHLTTWLLLLTKWLHKKKIILWGQGISVKRYLKESKNSDWKLKWQIALADGVWIYEEPETKQWQKIFPKKPIIALNNTLTGAEDMCKWKVSKEEKRRLKSKWAVEQDIVLIFCARFDNNYRRPDLLIETIERLDKDKYGFIIIGDGKNKPDFSRYRNVLAVGAVYDNQTKRELFAVADVYFQPGWVGLSIVEAMAYGKPIFTFRRSEETLQCVEYCYIVEEKNGLIFDDMEDCIRQVNNLTHERIDEMGSNARAFVRERLSMNQMVDNAISIL